MREVITDGENGRLFPFFDQAALVETVRTTLADREGSAHLAETARRKAIEEYDFRTVCLPQWRRFLGVG